MEFKLNNTSLLKALFIWCFFCSLIISLFYHFVETSYNLLFLKDLIIICFLILTIKIRPSIPLFSYFSFIFFIFLLLSAVFSDAALMAKAASIRQMVAPYIFVYIGLFLSKNVNLPKIKKYVLKISLLVLFLGIIEICFSIWHYINITGYFDVKNIPVYNLNYKNLYHYPVFFIEPILGGLKRMTSTMLDPINLGHTFAFLLSIVIFDQSLIRNKIRRYSFAGLFLFGLFLTFSKGAILQFIITILLMSHKLSKGIKGVMILFFSCLLVYSSNFHAGVLKHLEGLITAFRNINLFGHGLAKTGNQAYMFGEPTIKIGDTFFGAIIGQIGVIGYIFWIVPFYYIIKKLEVNLISKIFIAQIFISLISENSFNLLSIFLVCIFMGIEYKQKYIFTNV